MMVPRSTTAILTLIVLMPFVTARAEILPVYPAATVELQRDIRSPNHLVMLSPVREVRGEIRSESMARLAVEGEGRLLQLDEDASRERARQWYREQLERSGAQVLFECDSRACGRSNVWAHQIFHQAKLYGQDADQDYLAAGLMDEQGNRWLVLLYTVTRGNQRHYLWLEELRLLEGAGVPVFAMAEDRVQGPIVVPWSGRVTIRFDWDSVVRGNLQTMAEVPGSRLVIAGFSELGEDETLEDALTMAEEAATRMSALLDRIGISSSRHIVRTVGPTVQATAPGRPGDRIEILVVAPPAGETEQ